MTAADALTRCDVGALVCPCQIFPLGRAPHLTQVAFLAAVYKPRNAQPYRTTKTPQSSVFPTGGDSKKSFALERTHSPGSPQAKTSAKHSSRYLIEAYYKTDRDRFQVYKTLDAPPCRLHWVLPPRR